MKNIKKIFILTIIIHALFILYACSNNNDSSQKSDITNLVDWHIQSDTDKFGRVSPNTESVSLYCTVTGGGYSDSIGKMDNVYFLYDLLGKKSWSSSYPGRAWTISVGITNSSGATLLRKEDKVKMSVLLDDDTVFDDVELQANNGGDLGRTIDGTYSDKIFKAMLKNKKMRIVVDIVPYYDSKHNISLTFDMDLTNLKSEYDKWNEIYNTWDDV